MTNEGTLEESRIATLKKELLELEGVYGCDSTMSDELSDELQKKFGGDVKLHIDHLLKEYDDVILKVGQDSMSYGDYMNWYIITFVDINNGLHLVTIEVEWC